MKIKTSKYASMVERGRCRETIQDSKQTEERDKETDTPEIMD